MENLRSIARGYLDDCPIVGMSKVKLIIHAALMGCHLKCEFYVQNFYVEFRWSILHPHMNPTEEQSWTKPKSLEQWDTSPNTKSMKLDMLAVLLKYHLESDGRQPLMIDDSGRHLVPNPVFVAGNTNPDEPDQIIIFLAFVTSNQAIVDVSSIIDHSSILTQSPLPDLGTSWHTYTGA